MAQRDDIDIRWDLSPRLITIKAPSQEIIIQDLHDTLREHESRISNLIYPDIISSAGGENLGGGITVGLTSTLQNAQIKFEARYDHVTDGYVDVATTPDGIILTDYSATFLSDGIERGAMITNFDDLSYATIIRVISDTQIEHETLHDGIDNKWQIGDYYKIHNQIQCEINGGNLVAVDGYGNDIESISPSAFVQIVRTSASSATNQNSRDIEYASFNGGVTVDLSSSNSGTIFPTGTPRLPVNNFQDALIILHQRGFDKIYLKGNATVDDGNDFENIIFKGESIAKSLITIDSSANVRGCEFTNMEISGVLDGYSSIRHCRVGDILFFNGHIENCGLIGTITLGGGVQATIVNCYDDLAGSGTPTINMGGSGQELVLPNYNGGIKIINKTGNDEISMNLNSARVILDSTVTAGDIIVRGTGELENNSTANVLSLYLVEGLKIQKLAYAGYVHIDTLLGTSGTAIGTNGLPTNPCNTFDDALIIANNLNLRRFHVMSSIAHLRANVNDMVFSGTGNSTVHLDGYKLDSCVFENIHVTGDFDYTLGDKENRPHFNRCPLLEISGIAGVATNCILSGYVGIKAGESMLFSQVYTEERLDTEEVLTIPTTLDVNGGEIVIQGLDGYLTLTNVNLPDSIAIVSMTSGHIFIDPSCTDGNIIIRGNGQVTNGGSSTVSTSGSLTASAVSSDVFKKLFPFVYGSQ